MTLYSLDLSDNKKEIYSGHLNIGGTNPDGDSISLTNYYLEWNGRPWFPIMGEFHFSRYPSEYWEYEIRKMKSARINIISTYVFWIHHEEEEGVFDWTGRRDLRKFIELCKKHDLLAWVRMGPFCHGEVRNGGVPDWLYGKPIVLRCNNDSYLFYVKRLYEQIAGQLSGLLFKDSGPVIGVQLENEFMASCAPWETTHNTGMEFLPIGSDGNEHMLMLKKIAIESGIIVPIYSCTAWGSPVPEGEFLPVIGGGYVAYAWEDDPDKELPKPQFIFHNNHNRKGRPYDETKVPYAGCETGGGMQVYYKNRPVISPESIEANSMMDIASGCNMEGYYVFHGGTNPVGKHSYMNEFKCPRMSYDYQAPIREFGQITESFKRLKRQFMFIRDFGGYLAPMGVVLPEGTEKMTVDNIEKLRYAARASKDSGFIFLNNYQDRIELHDHNNIQISLMLKDETIIFPRAPGFTLKKDVSAILPFNMSMSGLKLKYSTTQLMTKLDANNTTYYFFFAPDGINPEYVFDAASLSKFDVAGGDGEKIDKNIYFTVIPGTNSIISLTDLDGQTVRICTLTHRQSLNLWKAKVWGRERVFLSDAGLIFGDEGIEAFWQGDSKISIGIFPLVDELRADIQNAGLEITKDGLFTRYQIAVPRKVINLNIDNAAKNQALVRVPEEAWDGVNDIFLEIDYEGDIGNAFINGQLVHDNFYNGTIWEIGMKRFFNFLRNEALFIKITPANKESRIKLTDMAAMEAIDGDKSIAAIKSIRAVPEYRVRLNNK